MVKSYPICHGFLSLMFSLFWWFILRNLGSGPKIYVCFVFSRSNHRYLQRFYLVGFTWESCLLHTRLGAESVHFSLWWELQSRMSPLTPSAASCVLTHTCIPSSNIFIWGPFYLGLSLRSSQMPLSKPYWESEGEFWKYHSLLWRSSFPLLDLSPLLSPGSRVRKLHEPFVVGFHGSEVTPASVLSHLIFDQWEWNCGSWHFF